MNPDTWSADRIRLLWGSREFRAVVVVFGVAALVAGWLVFRGSPVEQPAPLTVVASGSTVSGSTASGSGALGSAAASASPSPSATSIVVHVIGPVRRPGNVTLPTGSRVADAIAAAGGLSVGKVRVNTARLLTDGEQVDAGAAADIAPATPGTGGNSGGKPSGSSVAGSRVNLNTATADQLEELPRIGPATSAKIIAFRQQNGGFRTVDQLLEVPGIGDRTFAQLQPLVTV